MSAVVFRQSAGNSRSFFRPQVSGAEWTNGAMGNARYKGILLKDVLKMAGVSPKAVEASFRGLDEPPLQTSPHGFPIRLVVLG